MCAKIPQTGLEWLRRFERTRTRLQVDLEVGSPDVERLLALQFAEGAMLILEDGYVILLGKEPTVSAVLEEHAHVLQAHRSRFSDAPTGEQILLREIEVAECLEDHSDQFAIPEVERARTVGLLQQYRNELAAIRRWQ